MHFRIRGNNVQLVKTIIDPETKRARSRPVGSANLATGQLNARAREGLSGEEVAAVSAWLQQRKDVQAKQLELTVIALPKTLNDVAEWIRTAPRSEVERIADEVSFAMRDLRRAMDRKLQEAETAGGEAKEAS